MSTFFKIRKLKISSQYYRPLWEKPNFKPKLTISGNWLKEAGFEIGEEVTISVSNNLLIITPLKND